jgi:hypothetical protein
MVWSTMLYIYSNSEISSKIFSNKKNQSDNVISLKPCENKIDSILNNDIHLQLNDSDLVHTPIQPVRRIYVTEL